MGTQIDDVVGFWRDAGPERWFKKDAAFDAEFRDRFLDAHFAAARRELDAWEETASGALALLILLDQFPRNCFRGTAHMFATDGLARHFADRALARGFVTEMEPGLRHFFWLPFEHSENLADQERALEVAAQFGAALKYVELHHDIIRRFGRFPHRNAALGRQTTPEEQAFLDQGGFAG
jgi:uncharacterized protein (DUF924 family)